jgi:hypothetical protein
MKTSVGATFGKLLSLEDKTLLFYSPIMQTDRLCGLVVRVTGYRSRCPGSIPGATGFSEK